MSRSSLLVVNHPSARGLTCSILLPLSSPFPSDSPLPKSTRRVYWMTWTRRSSLLCFRFLPFLNISCSTMTLRRWRPPMMSCEWQLVRLRVMATRASRRKNQCTLITHPCHAGQTVYAARLRNCRPSSRRVSARGYRGRTHVDGRQATARRSRQLQGEQPDVSFLANMEMLASVIFL